MHCCWVWVPTYGALTENFFHLSWHVLQIGKVASVTLCVRAMQVLLTQYCPMLLYLGHLVRQCN